MLPSFAHRSAELEIMDDLEIQGRELELTLSELETINHTLGGYGPSLGGLEALVPEGCRHLTVLDVGTGGADVPMKMVDWGRQRGIRVEVTGIDLAETTIAYARRRACDYDSIHLELQDLFQLPEERQFDVVHAAAVLHHFVGDSAVRALAAMYAHARLGIVVNDLHRHPLAWGGIRVLTTAFSKSRLVKNDGPLSVLRAFTREELEDMCRAAGLPSPDIRWRPMFRWQVVVPRAAR